MVPEFEPCGHESNRPPQRTRVVVAEPAPTHSVTARGVQGCCRHGAPAALPVLRREVLRIKGSRDTDSVGPTAGADGVRRGVYRRLGVVERTTRVPNDARFVPPGRRAFAAAPDIVDVRPRANSSQPIGVMVRHGVGHRRGRHRRPRWLRRASPECVRRLADLVQEPCPGSERPLVQTDDTPLLPRAARSQARTHIAEVRRSRFSVTVSASQFQWGHHRVHPGA
jgi:hypothetical protein